MPQPDLVIGLDSSTTACKAVVFDRLGAPLAEGRAALPMTKPHPGWHEQPANAWWQAAGQALRAAVHTVDLARLAGLCITAQRETFVLTGPDGEPLGEALLWMDERCRELLPEIDRRWSRARFHQAAGKPLSANLSVGKLFWLTQEHPALFEQPIQVQDVHAFLTRRLTGRAVTSWGCADPTGLFDMPANRWNDALLQALGLDPAILPPAVPPGQIVGAVTPEAARHTGLPAGLPVIAGTGDGQAAGLGVCAVHAGEAYLNLGTAVVSGTFSDHYLVDPAFRTHYGGVPGTYTLETVLLGGTYTITWFIEQIARFSPAELAAGQPPEDLLEAGAAALPPGAQGLMLVPYWNTAMNPYWDPAASGIMAGWRGIHGRDHIYRAILEGIAFEQRLATGGVETALGQTIDRYIAVGGGARSPLWLQIIADITGKTVYRAETVEAAALGAGILAAVGVGLYPDVLAAAQAMTRTAAQPILPDPARQGTYTRLYDEVYRHLFPALQTSLDRLADLIGLSS